MSTTAHRLCRRADSLLKTEGYSGLARGIMRFARVKLRRVLYFGNYYVYRYPIPRVDANLNYPRVENLRVCIVERLSDIENLLAEGYEDPRVELPGMEKRLGAGAVAVCGFVSGRIAYGGWVATSVQSKRSFDWLPYRVAFDDGEAATGGAWTVPKFRGLGLYRYMFGRELDYLRQRGRSVCCNAIAVDNRASQLGQACYGAKVCARGRAVRILRFFKWTERPMSGPCPSSTMGRARR